MTLLGFFVSDRQQARSTIAEELRSARSLEPLRLLRHDADPGTLPGDLLREADVALYRSRPTGATGTRSSSRL